MNSLVLSLPSRVPNQLSSISLPKRDSAYSFLYPSHSSMRIPPSPTRTLLSASLLSFCAKFKNSFLSYNSESENGVTEEEEESLVDYEDEWWIDYDWRSHIRNPTYFTEKQIKDRTISDHTGLNWKEFNVDYEKRVVQHNFSKDVFLLACEMKKFSAKYYPRKPICEQCGNVFDTDKEKADHICPLRKVEVRKGTKTWEPDPNDPILPKWSPEDDEK